MAGVGVNLSVGFADRFVKEKPEHYKVSALV